MSLKDIVEIDQHATLAINGSDSPFWDNIMTTVTETYSWSLLIVVLLIIIFKNNSVKEGIVILLSIGLMMTVADTIASGIVKPMVHRWRPTQDPELMYLIDIVDNYRGGRFGFFSGHACNSFSMATFLCLLFRHRILSFVLYFWCCTTTFTRLYLGVHYLGDVIVGAIVGIILGILFYSLMNLVMRRMKSVKLISEQFTSTGYLKSDINMFLTTIFFNYICIIIYSMTKGLI